MMVEIRRFPVMLASMYPEAEAHAFDRRETARP
jgi:hypothetical protein